MDALCTNLELENEILSFKDPLKTRHLTKRVIDSTLSIISAVDLLVDLESKPVINNQFFIISSAITNVGSSAVNYTNKLANVLH